MALWDWSTTAGSNDTADANINWQEGQLPSTVNNSARAMMAAIKAFVQDGGGYAVLGGTADAFALTLSQTMTTKAPGLIGFFATRTNTGAVTLAVDSTTASPLRAVSGTDLIANQIVSGAFYIVSWNGATSEWIINGRLALSNADFPTMPTMTVKANVTGVTAVPTDTTITDLIANFPNSLITKAMQENIVVDTVRGNLDGTAATASSTVTVSIATPASVSWTAHGIADGTGGYLTTTGALPTGLSENVIYYVLNGTTNAFELAATKGGAAINTSGSQSGTHTFTVPATGANKDLTKAQLGAALAPSINGSIGVPSFVYGLVVKNNSSTPNTKITVTADLVVIGDTSLAYRHSSVSVTIDMAATGANGLDTGSIASSTWYHVFLISNGTTVAGLASTSATAPTLPSGYTAVRIGAMRTDASSHFYRSIQKGKKAQYTVVSGSNTAAMPAAATGSAGSVSTPTWTAASLSTLVPTTATEITGVCYNHGGVAMAAPNNQFADYTDATNPPPVIAAVSATYVGSNFTMMLESTSIYYASNNANASVLISGWVDDVPAC